MNKFTTFFGAILVATLAQAVEMGVPVQLKLKSPSGVYPDASGVTFTVQVLTPSNGCVLREEDFTNQTVVSGSVSLALGTGSRAGFDPNIGSLTSVYDNSVAKNNLTCVDGNNNQTASGQSYNPAATDTRVLRVRATILGDPIVADFIQRAAPYAVHAESVGGKVAADILVQNGATSLNQSNLETLLLNATRFNKLQNLAVNGIADNATTATTAGTATNFSGSLAGDVTGTQSGTTVGKIRGVTVAATAPTSGQVLGYDGSQYVPMTFTASAPVATVNGQTGAVVLNVSHIAGALSSSTSLSGDVTGNASATVVSSVGGKSAATVATTVNTVSSATALSTPSTIAVRDGSGNLVAAGLVATGASLKDILLFDDANTNKITISAPGSFASDYSFILPTTDGNSGEVLQTDGNGNLSWTAGTSVTSAGIISALGYTPADDAVVAKRGNNLSDLTSATVARTNLGLSSAATMSVGTSAGTLAAGNDSRITGALPQASFTTYVASANCTAGQSMYWNSVSSIFSCQNIQVSGDISGIASNATVTKLQGTGVSFASIANGHILQYNGTNIVNRAVPTCSAGEYLTFNGSAWSCAVDAGSAGSIASLSVSAPIASTGGANPTLSIAQANGSTNGYLASADWTTFNNKVTSSAASIAAVLGYVPASATSLSAFAVKANNLSDLASSATARTNLGLGGAALLSVGTTAGTVAAGDDSRITGALSQTSFNTYVASASCTTGQTMYWNSVSSLFACQNIQVNGDISGIASSVTVTKLQGTGVSFASIANGHILQYNGTNIVNRAVPTCSAGQYITFNGSAWSCATDSGSAGVVSSVAVTAPLQSTGGAAPTLSLPQATGSVSGYLTGTDWTTFNNKVTSAAASVSQMLGYTPVASSAASIAQVLGFSPASSATILVKTNNLSDLSNAATARANLGLGGFATVSSLDLGSASATGTLATARLPALTGDVNSSAGSNSLTVQRIQGIDVDAIAPTTGQLMVYNGTNWTPTNDPVSTVRKTADQAFTSTTVAAVTGMSFAVTAGVTYKFRFNVIFTSAATTTGAKFGMTAPAGTLSAAAYIPVAADGIDAIMLGHITSSGDSVTGTGVQATATSYFGYVEGIFVCTTTGTLQLTVGTEVNSSAITVKTGSFGELRVIP